MVCENVVDREMQGTVLGSVNIPGSGIFYFVEWDFQPRRVVAVSGRRIASASGSEKLGVCAPS